MSALVILSSFAIGWTVYDRLDHDLVVAELSRLQQEAHTAAVRFEGRVDKLRADANFLAQTSAPAGYVRALKNGGIDPDDGVSTPPVWLSRLDITIRQFMVANPEYVQVRYIAREPNGQELLRLDRQGDSIVRTSDDRLQQKSDRYYFGEALKYARPGSVYVSQIDLNQEFGKITDPVLPVLRALAPVYVGDAGQPFGFIVINLATDSYFDDIRAEMRSDLDFYVINGDGDFVVHPDAKRRFATELRHSYRIGNQWHQLAGFKDTQEKSVSFTFKEADGETAEVGGEMLSYDVQNSGLRLLFMLTGDLNVMSPQLARMRQQVAMTGLALLAIAIGMAVMLSRAFTRRLRNLARSANAVAAGNYELSLADNGRDEVGQLAAAMSGMAAQVKDKVERLQHTEEQLKVNANFLESVLEHVPAMLFAKDEKELRFIRVNRATEVITGFSASEFIGKNDFDLFPEKQAEMFTAADRKVLTSSGGVTQIEETITRKDGANRILHTKKVAVREPSGGSAYLLGICEDVTERLQAARDLEYSERRYRSIFDTAADGIVTVDEDGTVTSYNPAAARIFGFSEQEVVGQKVDMLLPPPEEGEQTAHFLPDGDDDLIGVRRDATGLRRDGSTFPMSLSVGVAAVNERRTFTGIIRDLSQEKANERRLIEARRQAEAANSAKSDFLATMSHELRTPLNAIIGYSEMLAEDAEKNADLAGLAADLHKIRGAGRHLLDLINDVLDLSKIEAGSAELEVRRFSIKGLVREVVDTATRLVETNGNRLEVVMEPSIEEVQTDPTRLRQILLNLLSNAAKFTTNGSVILTVSLSERKPPADRRIAISVKDSGIGVRKESLERIFDAFSQADTSTTRQYGGTGLGLAITRSNCELMGGRISVTSKPGKGAEFKVSLPAYLPLPEDRTDVQSGTGVFPGLPQAGSNRILVIEDDSSARQLLTTQLQKMGWIVVEASSGIDGLKLARELTFCAIILDVMMPELDGWSVLRILKDDAQLAHIPVVLCTIVDDKRRGFALGAADYLLKPVSRQQLKTTLSRYCVNPPCNLLIVEDDRSTREIFCHAARQLGWKVAEADTGKAALRQVAALTPDLIVLDLMMPELDGFGVVDALQKNEAWRHIPVVVVTAKDLTAADRQRLNGYVNCVIGKGDRSTEELLKTVTDALDRIARTQGQ